MGVLRHYWRKIPEQNKHFPDINNTCFLPLNYKISSECWSRSRMKTGFKKKVWFFICTIMQKRKFWNHLKWTLQSSSWNLLAHRKLSFGNPLSLTKIHLPRVTGYGNLRTVQKNCLFCVDLIFKMTPLQDKV